MVRTYLRLNGFHCGPYNRSRNGITSIGAPPGQVALGGKATEQHFKVLAGKKLIVYEWSHLIEQSTGHYIRGKVEVPFNHIARINVIGDDSNCKILLELNRLPHIYQGDQFFDKERKKRGGCAWMKSNLDQQLQDAVNNYRFHVVTIGNSKERVLKELTSLLQSPQNMPLSPELDEASLPRSLPAQLFSPGQKYPVLNRDKVREQMPDAPGLAAPHVQIAAVSASPGANDPANVPPSAEKKRKLALLAVSNSTNMQQRLTDKVVPATMIPQIKRVRGDVAASSFKENNHPNSVPQSKLSRDSIAAHFPGLSENNFAQSPGPNLGAPLLAEDPVPLAVASPSPAVYMNFLNGLISPVRYGPGPPAAQAGNAWAEESVADEPEGAAAGQGAFAKSSFMSLEGMAEVELRRTLRSMPVSSLKANLVSRGQRKSGRKQELIDRLARYVLGGDASRAFESPQGKRAHRRFSAPAPLEVPHPSAVLNTPVRLSSPGFPFSASCLSGLRGADDPFNDLLIPGLSMTPCNLGKSEPILDVMSPGTLDILKSTPQPRRPVKTPLPSEACRAGIANEELNPILPSDDSAFGGGGGEQPANPRASDKQYRYQEPPKGFVTTPTFEMPHPFEVDGTPALQRSKFEKVVRGDCSLYISQSVESFSERFSCIDDMSRANEFFRVGYACGSWIVDTFREHCVLLLPRSPLTMIVRSPLRQLFSEKAARGNLSRVQQQSTWCRPCCFHCGAIAETFGLDCAVNPFARWLRDDLGLVFKDAIALRVSSDLGGHIDTENSERMRVCKQGHITMLYLEKRDNSIPDEERHECKTM